MINSFLYRRKGSFVFCFILFLTFSNAVQAQRWYVNDNDLTGDRFTSAAGNDANPGTQAQPLLTMDAAIALAAPGDTIFVDAGQYVDDSVYIIKSLTLYGAKYETHAGPDAVPVGRFANETELSGTIYIAPSIDNVTIAGFYIHVPNSPTHGINVRGHNIKVLNNITNAATPIFSGVQTGISTRANGPTRLHSYEIKNNNVSGTRYGIYFDGNTEDPSEISDNYVRGASVAGIVVTASRGHHFSGNVVEYNGTQGFLIDEGNNLFERNTIKNNIGSGARLAGASGFTYGNSFINNFFENNGSGINLTNDDPSSVNNSAHYNSFTGNGTNIVSVHTALFDASCNWFESIDPSVIATTVSGNVAYQPFLVDGIDTDLGLSGFQPITACRILPIMLSSFNGYWQNKWAVLKWTTQMESNNRVFEVQRSTDGRRFATIATVMGAGNSQVLRHYQYNDESAASVNGLLYYRLKQVDFDGQSTLSQVVLLKNENNTIFTAYPNPAHDVIFVKLVDSRVTAHRYSLINYLGQTIRVGNFTGNYFSVPVTDLSRGTYLIRLSDNTGKIVAQSVTLIN